MNMTELVREVTMQYRGTPRLTKKQVNEVLHCALYAIIQDLIIRKGFGELNIRGFGRIYLNREVHTQNKNLYWVVRFRPSNRLKDLINDRITYEKYVKMFNSMSDEAIVEWNLKKSGRKRKGYKQLEINSDIKEMAIKYHISQSEIGSYLNEFQSGISRNLNSPRLSERKRKEYIDAVKYLARKKRRLNGEQE